MQKMCILLAFVLVFSFAACKQQAQEGMETTNSQAAITTEATEQETIVKEKKTLGNFVTDAPISRPPYISSVKDYFAVYHFMSPEIVGMIDVMFHEPIRDTGKLYPLIIFFHGRGENLSLNHLGTSGTMVEYLINLENDDEAFSAYTLVPITPTSEEVTWSGNRYQLLLKMIPYLIENYDIDPKRVYVTGISMGGFVTCQVVSDLPPRTFAAAIPLSGARNLKEPHKFVDTAFQIHHSTNDELVGVQNARNLYQQLLDCNYPKVQYMEYPSGTHASTQYSVFRSMLFYNWLFNQHLP